VSTVLVIPGSLPPLARRSFGPNLGRMMGSLAILSVLSGAVDLTGVTNAAAQQPPPVSGRITDAETGLGVADATVTLAGTDIGVLTDGRGLFFLPRLEPGEYELRVEHIAYGVFVDSLRVEESSALALRIEISQTAIELDPVVVSVTSPEQRAAEGRGTQSNVVEREEIEQSLGTAAHLGNVLARHVSGVRVRTQQARVGAPICVEFRSMRSLDDPLRCHSPVVVVDGVRVANPRIVYTSLPLEDIQRMEVIPPGEAGVMYGTDSQYGVLIIETQSGVRPTAERIAELAYGPNRSIYDWTLESRPYDWKRVFLTSFLANAAGLSLGLAAGRSCLTFDNLSDHFLESTCGGAGTAGARIALVTLPLTGAALGAQLSGRTDLSTGRLLHAFVGAALVGLPGYVLATTAEDEAFTGARWLGGAALIIGIPAAATAADRLFRRVRESP
jgi:hypothetical protein